MKLKEEEGTETKFQLEAENGQNPIKIFLWEK